jgi:hypothetical protein
MFKETGKSYFGSIYNHGFVPILIALIIVFYLGCQEGASTLSGIYIVEFDPTSQTYNRVATVYPPGSTYYTNPMIIDQMVSGDVNRDGIEDVVFCGNSGKVHVLTYQNGEYSVAFNSPNQPAYVNDFSQTCGIGDLTNDGHPDFYAVNRSGRMIYSYDGTKYVGVWASPSEDRDTPPYRCI